MRIAITGGTGFIGQPLVETLLKQGHDVFVLTRRARQSNDQKLTYLQWPTRNNDTIAQLQNIDVIFNLAGETINQRWTNNNKKEIFRSRLQTVAELTKLIANLDQKPQVFIQASAVGYYGTADEETFTEEHISTSDDFLATTVQHWESAAEEISNLGIRTVLCRFGVVLGKNGGALRVMALPYKLFAGGNIGNGRQYLSWIHRDDVISGLIHVMNNDNLKGPVNFTAPTPVTQSTFGKTLGNVLSRPHWLPTPAFALKILLGEMSLLALKGQRVLPKKLLASGFTFQYDNLEAAFHNIYQNS